MPMPTLAPALQQLLQGVCQRCGSERGAWCSELGTRGFLPGDWRSELGVWVFLLGVWSSELGVWVFLLGVWSLELGA